MSDLPDQYPIEIELPEIGAYATGNCGVPYLYSYESSEPGPHVMINALTHGNEVCGAIVVKALLEHEIRPTRGKLSLCFANVDAYLSFDANDPDASRFVDQDLNRVWTHAVLDNQQLQSSELQRARQLRPVLDTVDLLLDIHSMHERSKALTVSGLTAKAIALAKQLGEPENIVVDAGHADGCRLSDYSEFDNPDSSKNALLIECGQHWEASSVSVAKSSAAKFLLASEILDHSDLPSGWTQKTSNPPRVINVTEAVVAQSMDFTFAGSYTGLESFDKKDTIIGWNDGIPVKTPYDNCVLVMPSLRQLKPGVTVVRFGQIAETS